MWLNGVRIRLVSTRMRVQSLALLSVLKDLALLLRCCLDPALLWLWGRLAAAVLIQPLSWELPHAMGEALKQQKQTNNQKKKKVRTRLTYLSILSRENEVIKLLLYEEVIRV